MAPENTPPGLRERKKEQTRRTLRACAARLFAERGYTATTVTDIAAAANVSERTFFRYFENKESLLLPDSAELFAFIEAALAARPRDEDPLDAVCRALMEAAVPFARSTLAGLTHSLAGTEGQALIRSRLMQAFIEFEDRLALLVLERLPADLPDADLHANVIACSALSAARAVLRTQRARREAGTAGDAAPLLPKAFDLLALARNGTPAP
ncbi:TetR/AcrR family transcriptional regulator [Streptomyces sp. NPDC054904]|uniref:TetR/AcrR family transcriptional regulator n=1 Tax=unclassified Streptomyces TaxID=2593676 RepID=UPI002481BE17|nr:MULTISPECIES: TetR/AcrR family transcriptional regulator [unclassified Streptomyces]MDA5285316.1 TetR family transcriptional regulator [Streptomyces sp. Isolate_45]MDX2391340.1 TetR family transcriptional regulator [Streptomyces sp. DK15]